MKQRLDEVYKKVFEWHFANWHRPSPKGV
jgi:hypothetical protein